MNSANLTRRDVIRIGAGTLLSLGLWPGRLGAGEGPISGEFTFIAVNDLHYREAACTPWFEKVVAQMKASAPKAQFCLLGGDISDDGTPGQLTAMRGLLQKLEIPLHAVIGNHDYRTQIDRTSYDQIFPRQINYAFEHRGWQLLGLDTTEGVKSLDTTISETTLRWLDDNLPHLNKRKPTIIFTHFPLGNTVPARPFNADDLLQRCLGFNLQAIFCGHYHALTERTFQKATVTTDRCCSRVRKNHDGTKEKGWFVCRASNGEVKRTFVEFRG